MIPTRINFYDYYLILSPVILGRRIKMGLFINPLSPGILDPGKSPGGGPEDPQLYLGFLGLLYAP